MKIIFNRSYRLNVSPVLSKYKNLMKSSFTNDELDQLYDLVRDKHDDVMRGDWIAVKLDIADLHLLMSKLIYQQKGLKR